MKEKNSDNLMEKIVSLCKRRGFVYQGSEIYGGLAGTWDYGPLGVALKNNLKNSWWRKFVEEREDMYGLDSAVLMSKKVWQASGHTEVFADPLVEDKKTGEKYRADHLLEENGVENPESLSFEEMTKLIKEKNIKSPKGNELFEVKAFNTMFETQVGASKEEDSKTFLRPETAQGMFVNFKNILDSFYPNIPFGIAQIGKAFRNEISPREFVFRSREFEIMELEYFIAGEKSWEDSFNHWRDVFFSWAELIGLDKGKISELEVPKEDLAHYSKRTVDFEYQFDFGQKEIGAIAYRTDFDLKNHMKHSGENLEYTDKKTGERFVPHVIEPTFGLDRILLAVIAESYREDELGGEKRTYLALKPEIAPVQVAVFPLLKNKPELVSKAREVFQMLKTGDYGSRRSAKAEVGTPTVASGLRIVFDDNGNIGKRYRRQDEIGTPYCVTVDFDTLEDDTVTLRDRDTGEQERVKIENLSDSLSFS